MTDYFARLGQPRSPFLEIAEIDRAFRERARVEHPDASGDSARFAELNEAAAVLRNPGKRLRHLLELEGITADTAKISSNLEEIFLTAATLAAQVRRELAQNHSSESAIVTALHRVRRRELQVEIARKIEALEKEDAHLQEEVKLLGASWGGAPAATLGQIPPLLSKLAFVDRWLGTLRELEFSLRG